MSSLSGAWLALALLQLVLWIAACLLGAGLGRFSELLRARLVALLGVLALAAALAALAVAIVLATAEWAWGAEKLLVAAPVGVLSSALGAAFAVRALTAKTAAPQPALLGVAISAALGALAGPIAIILIGSVVTWPVVLAVALLWLSGSAVALAATTKRRRAVVVTTSAVAGLSVVLLALFTVYGPSVGPALADGGHHLPAAAGDATGDTAGDGADAVSVADLRETDQGTAVQARIPIRTQSSTPTVRDSSHPAVASVI